MFGNELPRAPVSAAENQQQNTSQDCEMTDAPEEACSHSNHQTDSQDSLSSGFHVNNNIHPSNSSSATSTSNLTQRRNHIPLSVLVEASSCSGSHLITQQRAGYQPETFYSDKGKSRATYVEDDHEPQPTYTGKGKGRTTYHEVRPPTPSPKDSPVPFKNKGKGRAIDVEDHPPTPPPKDILMRDVFSPPFNGPLTSLISPMRKLMATEAPRPSISSSTFGKTNLAIRSLRPHAFNLWEAIFSQSDITLNVARHMEVDDFVNMYCISKKFYYLVNSHMTTYILTLARVHAPLAMTITPYTFRRSLCILDPALRPHPNDPTQRGRVVPSPKWLQMVAFREAVSHDILLAMALEGHRFPHPIQEVVLKMWMLMDLPRSALRLSMIRNDRVWHNRDLFVAVMFLLKLDMRFSDPIVGDGECVLSQLLMAQRSLEPLWEVLRGWRLNTQTELLSMVVEWDYAPKGFDNPKGLPMFGVPAGKISSLSCEDWTPGRPPLLRPDEVILGECIRRKLDMNRCFVDFMLWGYVNWRSGAPIPLPNNDELKRRFKGKLGYVDVLKEYRAALEAQKLRDERKKAAGLKPGSRHTHAAQSHAQAGSGHSQAGPSNSQSVPTPSLFAAGPSNTQVGSSAGSGSTH
ncbi:uncharacterized protein IWZ02DRAFT_493477 [Phyllosticta citriasiana]|uniref:Uncharacterized protein n=1 Tax=Phyllosticta citriasiana TaxID=595635 RepID=A0ABR1KSY7_9PEZI